MTVLPLRAGCVCARRTHVHRRFDRARAWRWRVSKAKLDLSLSYLTNSKAIDKPLADAPRRTLACAAAVWPGLGVSKSVSVGTDP